MENTEEKKKYILNRHEEYQIFVPEMMITTIIDHQIILHVIIVNSFFLMPIPAQALKALVIFSTTPELSE